MNQKHTISSVELMDFQRASEQGAKGEQTGQIENIADVYVDMVVKLGKAQTTVGAVRSMKIGDILEVEKKLGHKVDIYLGETKVGIGEVVVIDNSFGIIISEIQASKRREALHEAGM
ncbi:FliM/FliN family flagellar motor switch protein [Ectobacillus ponti]|uniref:FliM/FliN family flagellar motor switch protein n=1 Tax=Ectobacillus ponti TaxID=2961894 RepID=A0AA42BSW2_9BACI|nr:FliM/FliN family flagellar motor switch protein [Ectobacillus ponti]MCP8968863.1 FliM/FliN family flagellar motor switch protein [Ectobacillus ponti]